jgi:hypothetical protein
MGGDQDRQQVDVCRSRGCFDICAHFPLHLAGWLPLINTA